MLTPQELMPLIEDGLATGDFEPLLAVTKTTELTNLIYSVNTLNKSGKLPFGVVVDDLDRWNKNGELRFVVTLTTGGKSRDNGTRMNRLPDVRNFILGCLALTGQTVR